MFATTKVNSLQMNIKPGEFAGGLRLIYLAPGNIIAEATLKFTDKIFQITGIAFSRDLYLAAIGVAHPPRDPALNRHRAGSKPKPHTLNFSEKNKMIANILLCHQTPRYSPLNNRIAKAEGKPASTIFLAAVSTS